MRCPRCLNEDARYFYKGSKGYYCRKCISFSRILIQEEIEPKKLEEIAEDAFEYTLRYPLTPYQKIIAQECKDAIETSDVFIDAVTGAGKTELTVPTIAMMLEKHKKVCFCVARRQVVLELAKRLQEIFVHAKVVEVCQGYTSDLDGDIVVCTTHQCFRYYKAFDCVILDEPDAFPYKGNKTLEGIVRTSCRGHMVYLTATADAYLKRRMEEKSIVHLQLQKRPHGYGLCVPRSVTGPTLWLLIYLIRWIKKQEGQLLIFVPTIKMSKMIRTYIRLFERCSSCTSKSKERDKIIDDFRNKKIRILVATTILERGVTIEGIQVCVFNADSFVFDEASLIQMSGRVGRSFTHPEGDCLFLNTARSEKVENCIETCVRANCA